ncbi:MAG: type II secretion system protein GspD [Burkholderiales bacterium]|nr:MAG: type II secretion system protein GspD [Burkholderiales bacterium]
MAATGAFLFANLLPPAQAQTPTQAAAGATRSSEGVKLDFVNAEIAEVARTFGVIMNRSFIVDPRVKGQMNLVTESPVHIGLAYRQFLSSLRLQGFAVVESAGIYKLVPEADAKLQGGAVNAGEVRAGGNQILTQIFRLNHENANNLVAVLRPLISPNNTINVNPGNNSLIITDYADNLQRMAKIIAALDVSTATDLEIIPLKHAVASDLVPLLVRLSESGGSGAAPAAGGQADTSFKTSILAEPRSNAVIVRAANPARINLIKSLIDRLDQAPVRTANGDAGNIYVVYLKNADAVKIATTLRAAISAEASGGGAAMQARAAGAPAAGGAAPVAASAQPSTGGQIQADPATNALIITAPEPQYRQMRAVIDKLDQRRAQVLVEVLIAQVSSKRAAEFGIQWQSGLGKAGNSAVGGIGTNFGGAGNILALSTAQSAKDLATAGVSKGLNLLIAKQTNGVYVLGALAKFLEDNNEGNILSAPNLLTLDNEEAKIIVGRNVPFVTGQFTNTGASGGGATNPFQTIERKDVGLTLRVKPQISEDGQVRLTVFQENSGIEGDTTSNANGPTTTKQSIETNIVVDNGAILVLGGLAEDSFINGAQKVPGLGDIPLLGNLFKSESRTREKRQLMLFLRPVIVRDSSSTESLSLDRYELMRAGQKDTQPTPSSVLSINEAPVLPPQQPSGTPSKLPLPLVIPSIKAKP